MNSIFYIPGPLNKDVISQVTEGTKMSSLGNSILLCTQPICRSLLSAAVALWFLAPSCSGFCSSLQVLLLWRIPSGSASTDLDPVYLICSLYGPCLQCKYHSPLPGGYFCASCSLKYPHVEETERKGTQK